MEIEPFNLNALEVHAHEHFFLYDTALWQVKPFSYQKSFEILDLNTPFTQKIALLTVAFVSPRTSGQITLSLTDVQTGALNEGRYVYDLVITDAGGEKTRVVEGIATIKPSVTR